jgi:MtaA/CmuA family methyltransferase
MTGKEILFAALKAKTTTRAPWVPFAGVHAGSLIDVPPPLFLQDPEAIVQGIQEVCKRYRPDGVPVVFDLQIEAEMLGCELEWASETPPAVRTHPLANHPAIDLDLLKPFDLNAGRLPVALEATRRLKVAIGETVALYGLVTGPLTLALHLRSAECFMDLYCDPEAIKRLMAYCAEVLSQTAIAYIEAGADVIAVVDPMISQISCEHFEGFVTDPLNTIFDAVAERGKYSSLFVCGDATRNLEAMCKTHCDNISVDENIDLTLLREVALKHGKSFGGNLKLTTTLLLGSALDAQKDAVQCLDIGGTTGYIIAPGCDLPYAVPPENLEAVVRVIHDPYEREVVRNMGGIESSDTFEDVILPNYHQSAEIIVDVVTLDSSACAPCQYMVLAAREASSLVTARTKVVEHKITTREGLAYMKKLGISAIPSLCIQGELVYSSLIPDSKTLAQAILSVHTRKR